jgi:hypothetical protein
MSFSSVSRGSAKTQIRVNIHVFSVEMHPAQYSTDSDPASGAQSVQIAT